MDDLDVCQACFSDLPRNHPCCYQCAASLATASPVPQACGACLVRPPPFDETQAPFLYGEHLRHLITRLKFQRHYHHARLLAGLLARYVADHCERPDCLIPVPLHPVRYRERGFNQSLEIARHLAKALSIALDFDSCIRHRNTPHQIDLPATERAKNPRQAFSVVRPLRHRHIAIIDDVMTTGATASAVAQTLKEHGVERVDVWVCARA